MDGSGLQGHSFDHYTRLVQRMLGVPISLVEAERQVVDAPGEPRLAENTTIGDLDVVSCAGWPLVDGAGRVIGSLYAIDHEPRNWTTGELEILEDLAQACSAELRQARESEHLMRAIFDSVDVAMAFYDSHERLVMANPLAERAAQHAGFRLDEPPYAGEHVRRSDNRTPVPFEEQVIPRALRQDLRDHEMEWVGPPGNDLGIVASAQQVRHSDGSPWGTLITAHDVTDVSRSLQVREEFIATVSHELRTPLTAILGYTELLAEELDPEQRFAGEALAKIRRGAVRLQHRIGDLLDTAERRQQLDLRSTDVATLVLRVADTFGEPARTTERTLGVEVEQQPLWAVIDAHRVEQALENLVSNALKYTRPGGHVQLSVGGDETSVRVEVADDGVGMTTSEAAQAFDSFWRADSARRGSVQGIGIGLTLVREIVSAHHGTVSIDTRPDHGTRVSASLPRTTAPRGPE